MTSPTRTITFASLGDVGGPRESTVLRTSNPDDHTPHPSTSIDGTGGHLPAAQRAAEEARNLTVGPSGPSYADANRDGTVDGASAIGLLPGLGGEPGLATATAGPCVERDVLGGSWADPAARWSSLESAIAAWTPSNNTFPALPSHPQRIVGWASLALATAELAAALEYGGHASLHVDVARRAVTDCAG